ncbi:lysogenization regulator HflD [Methylophaga sp. 42_25_T18]|nr:lysogenization regulator HflD [Methylophaga sp. 42_25_T18]OUR86051.1 lysogenization regulator HflD [Methylophaga sp. 42_8_T64]
MSANINTRERDRIIALAALMQVVKLVQQVADTGQVNEVEFETLLKSLLDQDAPTTEAVYGDVSQLKSGFELLNKQLSKTKDKNSVGQLRYIISLLHLERQLAKRPAMMDLITREIEQVPQQVDYFGDINNPQVIARLADIYHRTISELSPRIQVQGDPGFLQQADNVNRIRALLLAGIRAAILWRQKGGRRWQFLFQSSKILKISTELYQST